MSPHVAAFQLGSIPFLFGIGIYLTSFIRDTENPARTRWYGATMVWLSGGFLAAAALRYSETLPGPNTAFWYFWGGYAIFGAMGISAFLTIVIGTAQLAWRAINWYTDIIVRSTMRSYERPDDEPSPKPTQLPPNVIPFRR